MSTVHVKIDIDAPARNACGTSLWIPTSLEDWVTIHRSVGDVSSTSR